MNKVQEFKYTYKGILCFYYETGISPFVIVQDYRGIRNGGWDLSWAYSFEKKEKIYLKVYKDDKEIYSKMTTMGDSGDESYTIKPIDITLKEWLGFIKDECVVEVFSNTCIDVLKNQTIVPQGEYNLYLVDNENSLVFKGNLMNNRIVVGNYIEMRFRKNTKELYSKFYSNKSRIKSFNLMEPDKLLIQLDNGKVYLIELIKNKP